MNSPGALFTAMLVRLLPLRLAYRLTHLKSLRTHLPTLEVPLWILGTLYQLIERLVNFSPDYDHLMLFLSAKSYLAGMGFGDEVAVTSDLMSSVYGRMSYWPIGWSALCLPFLSVLKDSFWAMYGTEALGIMVFYLSMFSIMRKIGWTMNAFTRIGVILTLGFVLPPHLGYQFANMWAVALFAASCALIMPSVDGPPISAACFLAGVLAGCTVWMRYQCAFTACAPLLVLAIQDYGSSPGRRRILSHAVGLGIILSLFYYWRIYYVGTGQPSVTANMDARAVPMGREIHWSNLLRTPPVALVSLFGESFASFFRIFKEIDGGIWKDTLMRVANWTVTVGALSGACVALTSPKPEISEDRRALKRFYALAAAGVGLNLALLGYLSVIKPLEVTRWVFIEVPRYHAIGGVFIVIAIAHLFSSRRPLLTIPLKILLLSMLVYVADARLPKVIPVFTKFVKGQFGPPIENRFFYGPDLTLYLRANFDAQRRNVFVYFGPNPVEYWYQAAQARLLGYAADMPGNPHQINTSAPVKVVFALPRNHSAENRKMFEMFCAEVGGTPTKIYVSDLCSGVLQPRAGRNLDSHH